MKLRAVGPLMLGACVGLAGCGGGGGTSPGPQNTPPPVITFSHAYPAHQVMATKGTPWMITNIATTLSGAMYIGGADLYDTLRVDVSVSPNLSLTNLPNPGASLTLPNEFGVQVAIDSDNNPNTGGLDTCIAGNSALPFDYSTNAGIRLVDGNYSIVNSSGPIYSGAPNPPEEAVTSVSGSVISQSFYLPAIRVFSGKSIPHIGVEVGVFNGADLENTDCEPTSVLEQFTDM